MVVVLHAVAVAVKAATAKEVVDGWKAAPPEVCGNESGSRVGSRGGSGYGGAM